MKLSIISSPSEHKMERFYSQLWYLFKNSNAFAYEISAGAHVAL